MRHHVAVANGIVDSLVALDVPLDNLDVVADVEQVLAPPSCEVVKNPDFIALAQQAPREVGADETAPACHECPHRTERTAPPLGSAQIEPEISVVVPVWGAYAGRPLAEALESLRSQDLAARIIVLHTASEPALGELNGAEVIRSATRLTVGSARNLGLQAVQTPYVLFWDADEL